MINDSVEKEIGSLAWPGYSPPGLGFRTPEDWSGSVSRPKKRTHPTRLRRSPPRGGVGDRGWVGGGVGGIQPVPIVATVQLHLSQQRRDYFYKASDSVPRQQPRLKTSLESTLRAERKTVFYLVTLLQRLHSSFSPRAQPYGLTSAKCVLKRPIFTPPPPLSLASSSPPPAPPLSFLRHLSCCLSFCSPAGRVALLSLHRQDLWSQGLWQKQKGICQYLWETRREPPTPPPSTGAHSLIRYALIRHIDHRRDSTSPESSHRTFISNGACKAIMF